MKAKTPTSWRQVCELVPYASVMRWRQRQRQGKPVCLAPGPKPLRPLDWTEFNPLLRQLHHGRVRTRGTGELLKRFAGCLSRRQLGALVQDYRRDQLHFIPERMQKNCSRVGLAAYSPSPLIPLPPGAGKSRWPVTWNSLVNWAVCRFRQARKRGTSPLLPAREGGVRKNARSLKKWPQK